MDVNTDPTNRISCDTINEVTESMPIQCETIAEASSNVTEIACIDEHDHQRQETTKDDIGPIDMLTEDIDQHTIEVYEAASPTQNIDLTQESDEISTIVLDENEYLKEEQLQLAAAPDLSEFCGKTNSNEDLDSTLETKRKTNVQDVCSGGGNIKEEEYDMVFEQEDIDDGIETVEVMTLSEFIGCTDIGDNDKYLLDPKAKRPWADNRTYRRDCDFAIPKTMVCSGEDMPVTGATGIQTITRKDSQTDNVVVIIRPRSDSPPESKHRHTVRLGVSSYHNTPALDSRTSSTSNSFEDANRLEPSFSFPTRIHSDPESCRSNNTLPQDSNVSEVGSNSTELCENRSRMSNQSASKERKASETGVRRKRWVRQISTDTSTDSANEMTDMPNSVDDIKHSTQSTENIDMDELDPDWDAEDKLIWELLSMMKSVTKRPDDHSEIGTSDTDKDDVSGSSDNARKPTEENTNDNDHPSLISSEPYTSLDSFGERERERLISEKLQKRQAGGMTCITFLSPGYKRQTVNFTPIHCKEPLKLDAKEFFQKGFESSRKDISVPSKDTEQINHRTLNSSKLHSPRLFSRLYSD